MRIIAGKWRGRAIKAPKGQGTRPTGDRVREAVFSSLASRLGSDLGCGTVLDAFAGSGALGLEALSRGAVHATFVESGRGALKALRENVDAMGATNQADIVASNVFSLAGRGIPGRPFSLILLDPPYTLDAAEVGGLLESMVSGDQLQDGAVVTWEYHATQAPVWPSGFSQPISKRYGSTQIDIAVYERGSAHQ